MQKMDKYINHDPTAVVAKDTPLVTKVKDLMGRTVRCHLSDGRVVTGYFNCVDKHRNIILEKASELKSVAEPDTTRHIGYVLIPGHHLLKCEVQEE